MSAPVAPVKGTSKEVREISHSFIHGFSLDEVQKLHRELTGESCKGKKAEIVDSLVKYLSASLKDVVERLSDLEIKAISEALYSPCGYEPERFKAKYGSDISFGRSSSYHSSPKLIRLFLVYDHECYRIEPFFRQQLTRLIRRPQQPLVATLESLPAFHERQTVRLELQDDDPGATVIMRRRLYRVATKEPKQHTEIAHINIETVNRAEPAQEELWSVIRLIQQGKISVAEKSCQPSPDMAWNVAQALGGDHYQWLSPEEFNEIGCIKGFAWPMIMQATGLAERQAKRLSLTKAGLAALSQDPSFMISFIWSSWLTNDFFDEFRRIDCIKGQTGKAQRSFSVPSTRRRAILNTLENCPANVWISFQEFSRYLRAIGNSFDVTYDPWPLYIAEPTYGSLGYRGRHSWEILQERYMRCFLLEYAATLGLIDLAIIPPQAGPEDYQQLSGTSNLPFLSRYDGLLFFRINALGEFCLGKTDSYAKQKQGSASLSIMPNMRINLASGKLGIADELLLECFTDTLSENTWELSQEKSLVACENGQRVSELKQLLQSLDDQELPEQVETFLKKLEKNAKAVQPIGSAMLFDCFDKEVAVEIANHSLTKKLCQLTNQNQLVVKTAEESKFRKAIHAIGYGTATHS
jgi:hypothetical protein